MTHKALSGYEVILGTGGPSLEQRKAYIQVRSQQMEMKGLEENKSWGAS